MGLLGWAETHSLIIPRIVLMAKSSHFWLLGNKLQTVSVNKFVQVAVTLVLLVVLA
jgi:hypothetical protein